MLNNNPRLSIYHAGNCFILWVVKYHYIFGVIYDLVYLCLVYAVTIITVCFSIISYILLARTFIKKIIFLNLFVEKLKRVLQLIELKYIWKRISLPMSTINKWIDSLYCAVSVLFYKCIPKNVHLKRICRAIFLHASFLRLFIIYKMRYFNV